MVKALHPRVIIIAGIILMSLNDAGHACACCSDPGQRKVSVEKLDSYKLGEVTKLQFASRARLFVNDAGLEAIKGIERPTLQYDLSVSRRADRMLFNFRDTGARSGTLSLLFPNSISIFEVDPRDGFDSGAGPRLYKEWKLTSKAIGTENLQCWHRRG